MAIEKRNVVKMYHDAKNDDKVIDMSRMKKTVVIPLEKGSVYEKMDY